MITQMPENVKKKIQKATFFKKQNELVATAFAISEVPDMEKLVKKIQECGTYIHIDKVRYGDEVLGKVTHANFCKVRLCPMCQWRRSAKLQSQMMQVFEYLDPMNYRYILLTLTIPNPRAHCLADKITQMYQAWDRLMHRREVKKVVKGFYRALEVTHNIDDDTYHPHFHVILAVNPSYFSSHGYIRRDKWLQYWQESMQDPSITQVDVRVLKTKLTDAEIAGGVDPAELSSMLRNKVMKALLETCKYICKPAGLLDPGDMDLTAERLKVVHFALRNRRLLAFGGCFKDARRALGLTSVESKNADLTDADTGKGEKIGEIVFIWHSGYSQYRIDRIEGAEK